MTGRQRVLGVLVAAGAITAAAAAQVDPDAGVGVELEQFGVGNAYRPGSVTAILLTLTSNLEEAESCWVQWEVPNAEGDVAEYGRSISLSPGLATPVWLYAPLPPHTRSSDVWTVRVFEERNGQRRRELGGTRISADLVSALRHETERGLIAVIGRSRMGLDGYGNPDPTLRPNPPGAHEDTRIVSGISPQELPDRWEAFLEFEAVVWSDALPQQLRVDSANALREYVRRGGHLVINLPAAGNPWGLGALGQTWLDDLLVQQAPRTDEAVKLSDVIGLLSKSDDVMRDIDLSIRVFGEIPESGAGFDAIDNGYEPLMALPDGRVVVIQRVYGFGRVTMLGIDLSSSQLNSLRLPQADAFWNRVLGRRADTPFAGELAAMKDERPRLLASGRAAEVAIGDSGLFKDAANKGGRAEIGLLAATLMFIAYWLVACFAIPFVLKQRGLVRHTWLAFAAAAGLFTAIAWGGVRVLREHAVEFRHVTVLDVLAAPPQPAVTDEPQFQRGIVWGSLYSPGYGTAQVSVDSDPQQRDLLLTWAAPEKPAERFPNVDRYRVDVGRSPPDFRIPVRATATQLYANWLGGLDPDWGGTLRSDPEDPIRIEHEESDHGEPGAAYLAGSIIHELPGPLTDVLIIWVTNERAPRRRYAVDDDGNELPWLPPPPDDGRPMLNRGHMWVRRADAGPWYAGSPLVLPKPEPFGRRGSRLDQNIYRRYIKGEEGGSYLGTTGARLTERRPRLCLEMLSFYQQLTPPKYHRLGDKDPDTAVAIRQLGRELDLSAWFTRPCLIVIGYVQGAPTPVPLRVDGRAPPGDGLTVVRWIYPLPLDQAQLVGKQPPTG
jgi:hypothetical protein